MAVYCFGFFDAVGFEVDRFDAERAPREEDDPVRDFEECWPDVRPFDVDLEEPLEERLDELFDAPLEELDPVVRFDRPSWDERDDGFRFGCCATWGPFGAGLARQAYRDPPIARRAAAERTMTV